MADRQYRGGVDRLETVRSSTGESYCSYDLLVLRDVARLDGTPTASGRRLAGTGTCAAWGSNPAL
jgi:hypothetical protein